MFALCTVLRCAGSRTGVTANVLAGTVHDQVSTELEWASHDWAQPARVDAHDATGGVGELGNGGNVAQAKQRVGG